MNRSYWQIRLFSGDNEIASWKFASQLSTLEIELLLSRLLAKHYSDGDILRGSIRKNMNDYLPIFECIRDENEVRLGLDPFITARLVTESSF